MNSLVSETQWIALAIVYGSVALVHFMSNPEKKWSESASFFGGILAWVTAGGIALGIEWLITGVAL